MVLMPAVCLSLLEDQDFGMSTPDDVCVGGNEKPVVSCYALGEWRVSPDYFLHITFMYLSPARSKSKVSICFQGHFYECSYSIQGKQQ